MSGVRPGVEHRRFFFLADDLVSAFFLQALLKAMKISGLAQLASLAPLRRTNLQV